MEIKKMDGEKNDRQNISKLVYTRDGSKTDGAVRVYQRSDGSFEERVGGTAAWRHNNPGNLKFEYAHSADQTVHNTRTKEQALSTARVYYHGIIDLDQRGNVIFESVEKGHAAQLDWINDNGYKKTVAQMLGNYSKADYSGPTHYTQQEEMIYRTGDSKGFDLRTKLVSTMTPDEKEALAEGISKFEGWQEGKINTITAEQVATLQAGAHLSQDAVHASQASHPTVLHQGMRGDEVGHAQDELHTLGYLSGASDSRFGPVTKAAVQDFQHDQDLDADGKIGPVTQQRLDSAVRDKQIADLASNVPLLREFSDPSHPQHALYNTLKDALPPGTSVERLAQGTAACYKCGITRPETLSAIYIGDKSVMFDTQSIFAIPAQMDISQPAPSVQQTMQQVQQYDQTQALQQAQFQAQQAQINAQAQQGPVLGGGPGIVR
jgi:peptidoglycan hydrolase-like protein with peptidoglycan-binding domain